MAPASTNNSSRTRSEIDPEHLRWLVENRARTQSTSVKLFKLLRENPRLLGKGGFPFEARMLVGISFSLWRSAFLSDKTGYLEDTNQSAEKFLGEMLLTNAIAFSQERTTKDWTFNYYAENARYRLEELREQWEGLERPLLPPKGSQSPKLRWDYLQEGFDEAVEHFSALIKAERKKSSTVR
jgi:hypothetical protein